MDEGQLTSTHSGWGSAKDFQSFKSAMAVVRVLLSVPLMVLLDVIRFATEIESASSGELFGSVINLTEAQYAAQRGTGQLFECGLTLFLRLSARDVECLTCESRQGEVHGGYIAEKDVDRDPSQHSPKTAQPCGRKGGSECGSLNANQHMFANAVISLTTSI